MKPIVRTLFLLIAALALSSPAHAVLNYYFCSGDTGADAALSFCPGDNAYNGLSRYPGKLDDGVTVNSAYGPKKTLVGFSTNALAAGGVNLNIAYGGYMLMTSATFVPSYANAAAGAGLTIKPYTPPQGCGACAMPVIQWPGTAGNDEGFYLPGGQHYFTVTGIDLRGGHWATVTGGVNYQAGGGTKAAISTFGVSNYVTVTNNRIEGFASGFNMNPDAGVVKGWYIGGNYITNNSGQGFYGCGQDMLIENNDFIQNGLFRATFDHNIYLGGPNAQNTYCSRMTVRFNRLKLNHDDGTQGCDSTSLVAHKWLPYLTIEGNYLEESNAKTGCYGIQVDSYVDAGGGSGFPGLVIRGNRLVNMGGSEITCNACSGAVIENNASWRTYTNANVGSFGFITVPETSRANPSTDYVDGPVKIRNNFSYTTYGTTGSWFVKVGTASAGSDVVSNLFVMTTGATTSMRCFDTAGQSFASFGAFDYNICYRPTAAAQWSDQFSTLSLAQGGGFDSNSRNTDPTLAAVPTTNAPTYVPNCTSGCPAGHPTKSAPLGIDNRNTSGAREIGPAVSGTVKIGPAAPNWFN